MPDPYFQSKATLINLIKNFYQAEGRPGMEYVKKLTYLCTFHYKIIKNGILQPNIQFLGMS